MEENIKFYVKRHIESEKIDISNRKKTKKIILNYKPDFIFHLAAQALVNKSYQDPLQTFKTNAIGSANILNAIKNLSKDEFEFVWGKLYTSYINALNDELTFEIISENSLKESVHNLEPSY